MPSLLLQKSHAKAGTREFSKHLTEHLTLWKVGNVNELLDEAHAIQSRLPEQDTQRGMRAQKLDRRFSALVSKGDIHTAISLITEYMAREDFSN